MDKTLCGACGADGRGCTYEPHENCGFVNVLKPEIERLRAGLETAASALELTADWADEQQGLKGTAMGIRNDAIAARSVLSPERSCETCVNLEPHGECPGTQEADACDFWSEDRDNG